MVPRSERTILLLLGTSRKAFLIFGKPPCEGVLKVVSRVQFLFFFSEVVSGAGRVGAHSHPKTGDNMCL